MLFRIFAFIGFMLWYVPAWAQEPATTVTALAGGGVSLSDDSAAIPKILVSVDAPLHIGEAGQALGRLRVDLAISGLPGGAVNLEDPITWKSAELYGEYQRRVGAWEGSETLIVGRAGFLTRILPADQKPRQRFARVYAAGVRAQKREAGVITRSVALMYGRSEVASPDQFHAGQIVIEGHVQLAKARGVTITIQGDAHLQIGHRNGPGERDVLRMGVMAGWGG